MFIHACVSGSTHGKTGEVVLTICIPPYLLIYLEILQPVVSQTQQAGDNNGLYRPTNEHLSSNIKVTGFAVIINYEILMLITSSVVPVSKPLRHTGKKGNCMCV